MVHREYGATAGRRTDISVFATEDLAAVDGPALKVQGQYMKPRFAVELGTEKTTNTAAHIASDLDKLSRARERGYLIHFFRDVTRADPGTPLRAKTEEKLERIFRRHACAAEPPSHVKSLCFVLRLARSSKTIRGKCELLVPDTGIWRRVNLKRVREDVLALLEVSDSNLTTGST